MENSIFSGLTPANLRIAFQAAKESPEALGALVIMVVAVIFALAFAGVMASHHLGGFAARIQEDEERERAEEEAEAAKQAAERKTAESEKTEEKTAESAEREEQ